MNALKTFSVKTLAFSMIIALAAGCASVTDATFEAPEQPTTIDQPAQPTPETFGGNDDDVQPIYEKPE
ncbi:hypothetical protein NC796_13235 [Aliifodinibius sp. S!AR15-10]|uniref:hypothetical protein n=1 Tax=Aliifodinibius sp. S!AR15-10 TaxID=2950437 RepID=UPI002861349E|nr:hypothetical protein [Aliifodinibius sp. S!AR15-10]MDR8392111.1 hypothetical protein [Aliifodinibius sp. S!AR15-10]